MYNNYWRWLGYTYTKTYFYGNCPVCIYSIHYCNLPSAIFNIYESYNKYVLVPPNIRFNLLSDSCITLRK